MESAAPVPALLAMRARACSRSAWAISWPITIATSSSVSFNWSRMPVKKAILPPGMQKALICLLPIRLTSHFQSRARAFHGVAKGMRRLAMARRRCSCGLLSPASAPLARACSSSWPYCCTPAVSTCSTDTMLRATEGLPTSTCARAGFARTAPAAASRKARRGFQAEAAEMTGRSETGRSHRVHIGAG